MAILIGGVEYVTGAQIAQLWPDITADRLRDWVRHGKLHPLTVGELAAAHGLDVPAGADPASPARLPTETGPANLYRWADVVTLEAALRIAGRGAPRRGSA